MAAASRDAFSTSAKEHRKQGHSQGLLGLTTSKTWDRPGNRLPDLGARPSPLVPPVLSSP